MLMTPWGEHLDENCILTEYPRPQMRRDSYLNLNGRWEYAITDSDELPRRWDGTILVPFSPESALSGVGRSLQPGQTLWYRREVIVPQGFIPADGRLLLHFGAVDQEAAVYWNGRLLGRHMGGYNAFTLDATDALGPRNSLVVRVHDDTDASFHSRGKQKTRRGGIWYTPQSGIWQTVWMEAVDPAGLLSAHVVTDIDQGQLVITPRFRSESGNTLHIAVKEGGKVVATAAVRAANSSVAVLPVKRPKLWSPESPFLYDITYRIVNAKGEVLDEVNSYAGMRKVHIEGNRIYLNNEPYYQRLVLDQGFYPDGIWTAPSDAALKRDIELSMAAGFNGARLHQKAFEERFHYWADRLGYITWGEAPSWGMDANGIETARNFLTEWSELVLRDRNHPSLLIWTPMNEEWWPDRVQYPRFTADLYDLTKALDPTRPVNDASGGVHIKTDIWTVHNYEQDPARLKEIIYKDGVFFQTPLRSVGVAPANIGFNGLRQNDRYEFPVYDGKMPFLIDEVGGIKWAKDQDRESQTESWGYGKPPKSEAEFLQRLEGQIGAVLELADQVWGYCYTQLTDVEQEQNGVYYYDRTPKFDTEQIRAIFGRNPGDKALKKD